MAAMPSVDTSLGSILEQVAKEKGIDKKILIETIEAAILKAGKEAGAYGRELESNEDGKKLEALQKAGKLKLIEFTGRDRLKQLVDPVMAAYAKDIGVEAILQQINATK